MFAGSYNLSAINGMNINLLLSKISSDENLNDIYLTKKIWTRNNKTYQIVKYCKNLIHVNNIQNNPLGLFRSIIFSNNKINVFSPPKSIEKNLFFSQYAEGDCIAEEFVEGTMINLFYDVDIGKWDISSKTTIGANVSFFKEQPTFSELFFDICEELGISFENLPRDICYSFVMQHPKNRLVIPIKFKKLYLITAFHINNDHYIISEVPRENLIQMDIKNIEFPKRFEIETFKDLATTYGFMNQSANIMGIVIRHRNGDRTKIRNTNYEYIKNIRGNNCKLQYTYLSLRKVGNVKQYLKYFPGDIEKFTEYRKHVHDVTDTLHLNYINCFVKKEKKLVDYPYQFRPHMYHLHQYYLSMKQENKKINKDTVINYINNLHPSKLMYFLNYHMRDLAKQHTCMEI